LVTHGAIDGCSGGPSGGAKNFAVTGMWSLGPVRSEISPYVATIGFRSSSSHVGWLEYNRSILLRLTMMPPERPRRV
jgi:hypothetical protein